MSEARPPRHALWGAVLRPAQSSRPSRPAPVAHRLRRQERRSAGRVSCRSGNSAPCQSGAGAHTEAREGIAAGVVAQAGGSLAFAWAAKRGSRRRLRRGLREDRIRSRTKPKTRTKPGARQFPKRKFLAPIQRPRRLGTPEAGVGWACPATRVCGPAPAQSLLCCPRGTAGAIYISQLFKRCGRETLLRSASRIGKERQRRLEDSPPSGTPAQRSRPNQRGSAAERGIRQGLRKAANSSSPPLSAAPLARPVRATRHARSVSRPGRIAAPERRAAGMYAPTSWWPILAPIPAQWTTTPVI